MPPTPVSITTSPTLELSEPAVGAAVAGWVTHCTPPTGIHTQDAEESAAAHFIFFEQINFPPQPSSVKVSVCPDIRDGKANIQVCRFYWSHPHSPLSLAGLPRPGRAPKTLSFRPAQTPSGSLLSVLVFLLPPFPLQPHLSPLLLIRPACCLSSLNTGKCDLRRVLPSFNHP